MQYKNTMVLGSKFLVSLALIISFFFSGCETATNTNTSRVQTSTPNYSANSNMMMSNTSSTMSGDLSAQMESKKEIGSDLETQGERYAKIEENPFLETSRAPLSTFSIDVDTASYANVRRYLNDGQLPPKDAVRIEELINYFEYDYPQPVGNVPFSVNTEVATAPWNAKHKIVFNICTNLRHIGISKFNLVFHVFEIHFH